MTQQDSDDDTHDDTEPEFQGRSLTTRLGVALILLSGVLWFSMFAIPFTPLSTGMKAATVAALFAGVQVAWWSGAALAGPRAMKDLTQWFRRRRKRTDEN